MDEEEVELHGRTWEECFDSSECEGGGALSCVLPASPLLSGLLAGQAQHTCSPTRARWVERARTAPPNIAGPTQLRSEFGTKRPPAALLGISRSQGKIVNTLSEDSRRRVLVRGAVSERNIHSQQQFIAAAAAEPRRPLGYSSAS